MVLNAVSRVFQLAGFAAIGLAISVASNAYASDSGSVLCDDTGCQNFGDPTQGCWRWNQWCEQLSFADCGCALVPTGEDFCYCEAS